MVGYSAPAILQSALEKNSRKVTKLKGTVLFRRGEKARGMYLIIHGTVGMNFGNDSDLDRAYGPGALVGLPATLTGAEYSMTATVKHDAELGYWSREALESLLLERSDLCLLLLAVLGERVAENNHLYKTLLDRRKPSYPNVMLV